MNFETITYEVKGHVAYIAMNCPKTLNCMSVEMKNELGEAIDQTSANRDVYGCIITGSGRAFSTGTDIATFPDTADGAREMSKHAQELFNKVADMPQITIAVVNGYALGGGFELALACDLRIAAESAQFGFAEGTIGAIPCYGGSQRLVRLVGPGISKDLIFTGRHVHGQQAKDLGIITDFAPDGEEMAKAEELMAKIMKMAPMSLRYSKVCINRGAEMSLDYAQELERDLVGILASTHDLHEGAASFFEKRKPVFENR